MGSERGSGCRLPVPGQQFVDAIDRMVGDSCEDVAQIGLRVASVHFGGLDESVVRIPMKSPRRSEMMSPSVPT